MPPPVAPQPQQVPRPPPVPKQTGPPTLTIRDTERAYAEIEALDLSDTEHDAELFAKDKDEFMQKTNKRALEIQVAESQRRKRRRVTLLSKWQDQFSAAADADRAAYVEVHKNEVEQEVRLKEGEKAIADEKIKRDEAIQTLAEVHEEEEKARIQKEIERANKKIRDTEWRLQGITPTKELRNESPHNVAALGRREREVLMEGGLMTSFHSSRSMGDDATPEFVTSGRGRGRGGRGGGGAGPRKRTLPVRKCISIKAKSCLLLHQKKKRG
jgi:DNA helicase INO80